MQRIYLVSEDHFKDYLLKIGKGNISDGFRKIVQEHMVLKQYEKDLFKAAQKNNRLMKMFLELCE